MLLQILALLSFSVRSYKWGRRPRRKQMTLWWNHGRRQWRTVHPLDFHTWYV